MIDLETIRQWQKAQEELSVARLCEYDHEGAKVFIDALLAEVARNVMRLFEITDENIKLRAELELVTAAAVKRWTDSFEAGRDISLI